jgi:tRNA(Arg) A34 adenosine deaminase TadA
MMDNIKEIRKKYMRMAIELAEKGMDAGEGGPFGAVIVKDGVIVGKGNNRVTSTNDPTAHAEMVAIRDACANLNSFQLEGCEIYTSCEPCPMCLSAIYWSRPKAVYYACTKVDAAEIGFDDDYIYHQIYKPIDERDLKLVKLSRKESLVVFKKWDEKEDKIRY